MRFLSILLAAGAIVAAVWLGGETWLAARGQRMIDAHPELAATSVTPLRRLDRIGLRLDDLAIRTPEGEAVLPSLDLWAAPGAPTHIRAALPAQMQLPLLGRGRQIAAQDAEVSLRLSPLNGMAVRSLAGESGPVSVEGAALLTRLDLQAQLTPMGAQAPATARAAYAVTADWAGLTPTALLELPEALADQPLSGQGKAVVFLTGPLRPGEPEPQLAGIASSGFTLTLGPQTLRIAGRLAADADNRAEGALFLYTADARAWMQLAGDLGLIPPRLVMLAGTALEQAAAAEVELPAATQAPDDPGPGELRIPLIFRDGRVFLGPLPLGNAPRLSR